ncbi:hypothetical protein KW800_01825 [Candidatus Parcubacteria bacterium]|nr:hypothetical protein [Candidatus Parcubacteria bacterium]
MKKALLALSLSLALPMLASASTAYFTPATVTVKPGQSVTLSIIVDPQGAQVYTAKIAVSYPSDLVSVTSFSPASGWLSLNQPGYDVVDNAAGSLIKTAGYAGGFSGVKIFGTITLTAKASGSATVSITGTTQVLGANNENSFSSGGRAIVVVSTPTPATTVVNPARPLLKKPSAPVAKTASTTAASSTASTTATPEASSPVPELASAVSTGSKNMTLVLGFVAVAAAFLAGIFIGRLKTV